MPVLNGPRRMPREGRPDSVVVMLHGIGSDGDDLISLADFLAPALPSTAFHAPNAPHRFDGAAYGYQWYSRRTPETRVEGVRAVAPTVNAFVDELAAQHGLTSDRCVLLGFSQGCIVSLHAGPRRKEPLAGVVGLSGALVTGDTLAAEIANRAPVFLAHGEEDGVLPAAGTRQAAAALEALGVPVELHILTGLGHSIDGRVVQAASAFMRRVLSKAGD
ncbi:MAG: phospholipase [SAR202 cluster bacterium]|nr:phospholipase [SAR202 cluster bacterium]